jgi:hypothetical protein
LEDLRVDDRIILKWKSKKWEGKAWAGLFCPSVGTGGGRFECGNEPVGSIKFREFLD